MRLILGSHPSTSTLGLFRFLLRSLGSAAPSDLCVIQCRIYNMLCSRGVEESRREHLLAIYLARSQLARARAHHKLKLNRGILASGEKGRKEKEEKLARYLKRLDFVHNVAVAE